MNFGPTDVITILGKRGSGKSTLAWRVAKQYPRLIVFDRLEEHDESNFDATVYGFEDFSAWILENGARANYRLLFRFSIEGGAKDEEFNHSLRILYYLGNCTVLIEEVWNFADRHSLPKWFKEILLTGRHAKNKIQGGGLAVITTSQRPAEIHKIILSQSSHVFSGVLFESNDIKYLGEFMGKDQAEKLRLLAPYHFLLYRPGTPPVIIRNDS